MMDIAVLVLSALLILSSGVSLGLMFYCLRLRGDLSDAQDTIVDLQDRTGGEDDIWRRQVL